MWKLLGLQLLQSNCKTVVQQHTLQISCKQSELANKHQSGNVEPTLQATSRLALGKLLDGVGKVATSPKGSMLQRANISIRAKFGRFGLQKILKFF